MKYIITGGTGHLGNTVVRQLQERGERIKLLLLPNESLEIFENKTFEVAYGNILDKDFLTREIEKDSIVIHMAGIVDISNVHKAILYAVNVDGTKNICDVCLSNGVKRLVYTSSVHTLFPLKKGAEMVEPQNYDYKVKGEYAKSKLLATKYVSEMKDKGLDAIVCYPSGIIGPNDFKLSNIGQLLIDIINSDIFAIVNGGYNFVDVRDVASGVLSAVTNGASGDNYILSGNNVTIEELLNIVHKKLGRVKKINKIAMWFVKMFARPAEFYYKVRGVNPLFTAYSLYTLTSNHNFNSSKAQEKLNFSIRPTEDTINDAIDFLLETKQDLIKPPKITRQEKKMLRGKAQKAQS